MKLPIFLVTTLLCDASWATAIYHDKNQLVPHFSDRPSSNSQAITLPPSNQTPLHVPQIQQPLRELHEKKENTKVWFVTPQDQETFDTHITQVPVHIGFSTPERHLQWILALNGKTIAGPQRHTLFTLPYLERGSHILTIKLHGQDTIQKSITIHQKRAHLPSS